VKRQPVFVLASREQAEAMEKFMKVVETLSKHQRRALFELGEGLLDNGPFAAMCETIEGTLQVAAWVQDRAEQLEAEAAA